MSVHVSHTTIELKLLQWFLFSVVLGVSSIALEWLFSALTNDGQTLQQLLADGELLIVAVALAGAGLSDIVIARSRDIARQLATFVAVVCIIVSASIYGLVQQDEPQLKGVVNADAKGGRSHLTPTTGPNDPLGQIVGVSQVLLLASVVVGGGALLLKET